jgi:hypothetical protein
MIIRIIGWLINLGEVLFLVNLLTLLIAAFVRHFRRAAGGLLFVAIWAWGLTLIVWCAARVFFDHGLFLTIFGLLMGGVGIIPVAFLSLLMGREWIDLLELVFQAALVLGSWQIAKRLIVQD